MRTTHPFQRGLWGFNGVLFLPNGVDGTGTGAGLGSPWVGGGTVSHPAPTTGLATQLKRTLYTEAAAVGNQELGPRQTAAFDAAFAYGTAVGRGGFYYSAVFTIDAWFNNTGRLFVGLGPVGTSLAAQVELAGISALNTHCVGLYHDGNDGANILNVVSAAGGVAAKGPAITGATLAPGQAFHWEMWCYPGTTTPKYRLTSLNTGAKIAFVSGGAFAAFMAPQCQMSNGASDVTAGHFGIGVANVYVEPALAP